MSESSIVILNVQIRKVTVATKLKSDAIPNRSARIISLRIRQWRLWKSMYKYWYYDQKSSVLFSEIRHKQ